MREKEWVNIRVEREAGRKVFLGIIIEYIYIYIYTHIRRVSIILRKYTFKVDFTSGWDEGFLKNLSDSKGEDTILCNGYM